MSSEHEAKLTDNVTKSTATKQSSSSDIQFDQCEYCGKKSSPTVKIRACTRCFSVGYCSKHCQKSDWLPSAGRKNNGSGKERSREGHRSRCKPAPKPQGNLPLPTSDGGFENKSESHQEINVNDDTVRLQVKDSSSRCGGEWKDLGPIQLIQSNTANVKVPPDSATKSHPPMPSLKKYLPLNAKRILGEESKWSFRNSPDGIDENLLILFHGAGDSHIPYDSLGQKLELPQTATLSLSASLSLQLPLSAGGTKTSSFVELPFGLGFTWFEEMDYVSTGETLSNDDPRRLKSLHRALESLDCLLCSLTGIHSKNDSSGGESICWIPERIFLFGFSAGACLAMEICRFWLLKGRTPMGGAICIGGGIKTRVPPLVPEVDIEKERPVHPTDVLIITGSKDNVYPKEAAWQSKRFYNNEHVEVHVIEGKDHSMIASKEETKVVMKFLSKKLVRRMVLPEGRSCV